MISEPSSEFERGRYAERVHEHGRRLDAINGSIDRTGQSLNELELTVARIGRTVAIYAALAAGVMGIVGSVIGALIVWRLTGTS